MSNLILTKGNDVVTLTHVKFNNSRATTLNNLTTVDLIVKNDIDGNIKRLDFTLGTVQGYYINKFIAFSDTYAGQIVTCQFEELLHFGYIESYNVSHTYTQVLERSERDDETGTVVVTNLPETAGEISFSFMSFNSIEVSDDDGGIGSGLDLGTR